MKADKRKRCRFNGKIYRRQARGGQGGNQDCCS